MPVAIDPVRVRGMLSEHLATTLSDIKVVLPGEPTPRPGEAAVWCKIHEPVPVTRDQGRVEGSADVLGVVLRFTVSDTNAGEASLRRTTELVRRAVHQQTIRDETVKQQITTMAAQMTVDDDRSESAGTRYGVVTAPAHIERWDGETLADAG